MGGKAGAAILSCLLLAGCTLAPQYVRPQVETPAAYRDQDVAAPGQPPVDVAWWTTFRSKPLPGLIVEATALNTDIRAATERVEQARAAVMIARSGLFPLADLAGAASWRRVDARNRGANDSTAASGAINISYEVDLFGRIRSGVAAAEADLAATEFDRLAVDLVVTSDVAALYFTVLLARERLRIADDNIRNYTDILKIVTARFEAGAVSALDVARQKSDLAQIRAGRASAIQQIRVAENALAVLTGHPPRAAPREETMSGVTLPKIATGQPSELMLRRPDIRRAEALLVAANADIGAARAAFYPTVRIGIDQVIAANPLTLATTIGGSLLQPIFQGGRLKGNLMLTEARQRELVEIYRRAVLAAFREVDDSLAAVRASAERVRQLAVARNEAVEAMRLSRLQYEEGAIDFESLLDAQRTVLQTEDSLAQARFDRLLAAVNLYRALGGSWES